MIICGGRPEGRLPSYMVLLAVTYHLTKETLEE